MRLSTLCYIRKEGRTLLLHRVRKKEDINRGKWVGLGGKMEPGETPEECVVREVREESGLIIRKPALRGILTFPAFDGMDHWYVFVFTTEEFEGELTDSSEGVLRWVPDGEISSLELWDGDRVFLKWLDDPRFFSAKLSYGLGGKFLGYTAAFYDTARGLVSSISGSPAGSE